MEVVSFGLEDHRVSGGANMSHKYSVGQDVYYQPSIKHSAARDIYKIVARLSVEADDLLDAEREEHAHHLEVLALRRLLVQHATAGRVTYRLTPWVPNNQNAEVSHNTIRMANSAPPATGSAQPG